VADREQDEQADQDQADVSRQQQQSDFDCQYQPVAAAIFPDRTPIVQQDDRPQRHGQDHRAEVRGRDRERRHSGHQQHGQRRVRRADDRTAEREHRPVGHHHADLRQQIDPDHPPAGDVVGDFGEPERERRSEIGAELKLVPYRQHGRNIAGRRSVKDRRQQEPQCGLQDHGDPDRHCRTRTDQLDED